MNPAHKPWTNREERLLAKWRGMGMRFDEIGELLERSAVSVRSRWKLLGLTRDRRYTAEEKQLVREQYGGPPPAEIAAELGRTVAGIQQLAKKLGVAGHWHTAAERQQLKDYLAERHAEQWSDQEIADGWSAAHPEHHADRKWISELRERLGLPAWGNSERRRRRVAEKTKQQLRQAGLPSLAAVRVKAFTDWAARMGWPGITRPRLVQILNLLYERGPHTRLQIAQALGLRTTTNGKNPPSRKWCTGNGPGGTYTATLIRMGLVVKLPGRPVRGNSRGRSFCLYAIAPNVKRSPIDDRQTQQPEPHRDRGAVVA